MQEAVSYHYLKNPVAIETESFAQIKAATDLSGFDEEQSQIVLRLVHTCGNPDVARQIKISDLAASAGVAALANGAPVLCDVEMVRQGLTKRYLNETPMCFLNDPDIPRRARDAGETRTMTAVSKWVPYLKGSIVIVGNAPTALFRLLELLHEGVDKPALIIGMPVGFVGAAESKDVLWEEYSNLKTECITIEGRTGGSALAAGAFNTLIRLQRGLRF
ncbi:MAG: precorrin-8X methylmutase [Pseudomonadota bacterium]